MKKLPLYIAIILFNVHISQAQDIDITALGYHDRIPLTIQSGVFLDSLYPGKVIYVVTGHLTIRRVSLNNLFNRERIISANDTLYDHKPSEIEFRIAGSWKRLKPNTDNEVLIDTFIQAGGQLTIQFRKTTGSIIIQNTIIKRVEITPSILGYRTREAVDTSPVPNLKANYKFLKLLNPGYSKMGSNPIVLQPGQLISFQIDRINENKDSCIEFRLREGNKILSDWIATGHILNINSIVSNTFYTLDLRYKESRNFISYEIEALPKWFEHTWIKLLLTIISLGLIFIGYIFTIRILRRRQIKARKLLEQQIRNLQAKLNPHFMYNVLGSISGLMAENEKERALKSLTSFAEMLRETLNNSDRIFIPLSKDIAMMRTYSSLEQLRFDFTFRLTIDPAINAGEVEFPPMLIQPSIENAISHGMASAGSIVSVSYQARDKDLIITIQDNGLMKPKEKTERIGYGIPITKERIKNMQKLYPKEKITYEFTQTKTGTIVRFIFTNWL